jgi:hypothetical protein
MRAKSNPAIVRELPAFLNDVFHFCLLNLFLLAVHRLVAYPAAVEALELGDARLLLDFFLSTALEKHLKGGLGFGHYAGRVRKRAFCPFKTETVHPALADVLLYVSHDLYTALLCLANALDISLDDVLVCHNLRWRHLAEPTAEERTRLRYSSCKV